MLNWSFRLLLATCVALTTKGAFIQDVDWVTAERANKPIPITGPVEPSDYTSSYGVFRHWTSGKFIYFDGDDDCPWDNSNLVLRPGSKDAIPLIFFQEIGHYGYLVHECPGHYDKAVFPEGQNLTPDDHTIVKFHRVGNAAALFTVDQENLKIIHHSGKTLWPHGGSSTPEDDTPLALHEYFNEASRFEFIHSQNFGPIPIFPDPDLNGYWRIIHAAFESLGDYEVELSYAVGMSISKQASEELQWTVSARASAAWFENSLEYSEYAELTGAVTWDAEVTRILTIIIPAGTTVVTWQYFFEAEQFGDGLLFRSTLTAETDNINTPPQIF